MTQVDANKRFDGLMLHGYGEDWPSDRETPDVINQLQINALVALVRRDLVENVFLGAGKVDSQNPTIAAVMEWYLKKLQLQTPIVVNPPKWPASTRDEMRAFRDQSHEQGWQDCICVGIAGHGDRIQRARDRLFPEADYMSTEDVILNNSFGLERAELDDLMQSSAYRAADARFRKRERSINLIDSIGGTRIDIGGSLLDFLNRSVKGIKKLEVRMGK